MNKTRKRELILLLLFSTFLGSLGQLLFKLGLSPGSYLYLGMGLLAYLASTLIYLFILGRAELSWAYGIGGLAYIFASLLAFLFLGEQVSILRWAGIFVIAIGTALVGLS